MLRREASRRFRKKKGGLKAKIDELETNGKIKKKSGTWIGASMIIRRVTSLEII